MSLVAAYSDSDSESDSDNEDESKQSTSSEIPKNEADSKETISIANSDDITTKFVNTEEIDVNKIPINATTIRYEKTPTNATRIRNEEISLNTTEESSLDLGIEDEDDWLQHGDTAKNKGDQQRSLFSILPQPKTKEKEAVEESDDEFLKKKAVFNPDVETPNIEPVESVEGAGEEEKPLKRSLLTLPKPSKKSGKRQPVQISIPTLDEFGADSESDEEEGKEKKKINFETKKKSTLFAMLPKPRHSVTVCANKNKVFSRDTNRPLVPHTLTKKKETTNIKTESDNKETKVKSLVSAELSDSDSDNDIPSDNFFSLADSKESELDVPDIITSTSSVSVKKASETVLTSSKDNKISPVVDEKKSVSISVNDQKTSASDTTKANTFFSNLYKSNKAETAAVSASATMPSTTECKIVTSPKPSENIGDGVKSCNTESSKNTITSHKNITEPHSNVTEPYSDVTEPYSDVTEPYSDVTAPYGSVTEPYSNVTAPYESISERYSNVTGAYCGITAPYNSNMNSQNSAGSKSYPSQPFFSYAYRKSDNKDSPIPVTTEPACNVDYYNQPNADLPIEEDALKALQGRKRRKEEINLIDINADDIQANHSQYLKNLTAESGYKPKSRSKDQPSFGQKRKHQITYLAFQAKERELQLQQSWSESHATKRQTQSKYGF